MVSTNELKNGMAVIWEGNIMQVMEFLHVKPGKGSAFVRTKLKNLRSGAIIDHTFNAGVKLPKAMIDKVEMNFLYVEGTNYVFMDNETYEQIEVPVANLKNESKFLVEGMNAIIVSHKGEMLGCNLPDKVVLQVTKTDPAVKGDTKTNALKDAIMETGLLVKVPMFIEEGEKLIISTQTSEYVSREKQ